MVQAGDERLAGVCALYCGDCVIFKAGKDRKLAQEMAEKNGWPVENIRCDGCKGAPDNQWSDTCRVRLCATERGFDFCYRCSEYPCEKFDDLAKRYPHLETSMGKLRALGIEKWLEWNRQGRPQQ